MLPVRPVSLTGQTGPILILATLPVRPVLTEACPKFTHCKLQLHMQRLTKSYTSLNFYDVTHWPKMAARKSTDHEI